MTSSNKHRLAALAGIAATAALGWWLQRAAPARADIPASASQAERSSASAAAPRAANEPPGAASDAAANAAAPAPVAVEAVAVRSMRLADSVQAVGSLRSRQSVVLRPEVGGRITAMPFGDGQRVRRGQLLVQFDDRVQRAQIEQNQAELALAQANHGRNQELAEKGFISRRAADESAANVAVAKARLALAQASALRLQILAPFDGVAGIRSANPGDYLKDGADIVNIEELDALYLDFRLPERLLPRLQRGQRVQLLLDALPGQRWPAVVQAINPLIDADARSIAVRACLDNRGQQLRPGMFARVSLQLSDGQAALMLPEQAIVPGAGGAQVQRIVAGSTPGSWVSRRSPVTLGARKAALVQVLSGVASGDLVVSAGQQRIRRDGTPLRLVTASGAPDQPDGAPEPARPDGAGADAAPDISALPPAPRLPGPNPCQLGSGAPGRSAAASEPPPA